MTPEEVDTLARGLALFILLVPFIGFLLVLFWFITLVRHLGGSKGDPDRLTWTLVLIFLNWIGAILYWTVRKRAPRSQTVPARSTPPPLRPAPVAALSTPAPKVYIEDRMDALDPDWRYKPSHYREGLRSRVDPHGKAVDNRRIE